MEADQRRLIREHDANRALNHHLAHLVAYAFHDPKEMPEFRESGAPERPVSNAADHERVRGFFISMALAAER